MKVFLRNRRGFVVDVVDDIDDSFIDEYEVLYLNDDLTKFGWPESHLEALQHHMYRRGYWCKGPDWWVDYVECMEVG